MNLKRTETASGTSEAEQVSTDQTAGTSESEQVSGEQAAGTSDDKQVSDANKGPIKIDPAGEYLVGSSETPLLGTELLSQVGQAAMKQKFQAAADTAQKELAVLEGVAEERDALQAQLEKLGREREVREIIGKQMPASPPDEPDPWFAGSPGDTPSALTPDGIANQISQTTEDVAARIAEAKFGDMQSLIDDRVATVIADRDEQRKNQQVLEETGRYLHEERVANYMTNLGFAREEAERLSNSIAASQLELLQGRDASTSDSAAASEHFKASARLFESVVDQAAGQKILNDKARDLKELEESLEGGAFIEGADLPKPAKFEPGKYLSGKERRAMRKQNLESGIAEQEMKTRLEKARGSSG